MTAQSSNVVAFPYENTREQIFQDDVAAVMELWGDDDTFDNGVYSIAVSKRPEGFAPSYTPLEDGRISVPRTFQQRFTDKKAAKLFATNAAMRDAYWRGEQEGCLLEEICTRCFWGGS